jgi:RNA polymerase sigma-70 factor (ECF subfamily)
MELASRSDERPAPARPAPLDARHAEIDSAARAAARGDLAAFERFYRASVARVHTLARRLVGAEADEATQEVYLRAWRGLAGWRGEASAATWLHRVALNTLLDLAGRRAPPETGAEERLLVLRAAGAPAGARLELEEAIAALPEGARAVFVLHDVEGCAHAEIAARLAIAVGTSKSQLHRARLLLRAALGEGRHA